VDGHFTTIVVDVQSGDRVIFRDDEPELDLPEGTEGIVTKVASRDAVSFTLDDGRAFVTEESSLQVVSLNR